MKNKKQQIYNVGIIGAGASGIVAAISVARSGGSVLLIDHMNRIGKKILATGNGKCNITNQKQGITYYRGDDPAFVLPIFQQFGLEETLEFFADLGVTMKTKNGYYYPHSEQATAVLEVLCMELERLNVRVLLNTHIERITKQGNNFLLSTKKETLFVENCILTTGSKASPTTGSDGSGYQYVAAFGHTIIDVVPALVQLKGKQSFFKDLAGIRADITAKLDIEGEIVYEDTGELQLTNYGISGIPIFQLSRFATKALQKKQTVTVYLDFMPDYEFQRFDMFLQERFARMGKKTIYENFIGLFNKKLIPVFLKEAHIEKEKQSEDITNKERTALVNIIKSFKIDIYDSNSFENAQVCAGGVSTKEIDNDTLESKKISGLYFAGELIDIDGACGGYNLQWAWSSGYIAGKYAALNKPSTTQENRG